MKLTEHEYEILVKLAYGVEKWPYYLMSLPIRSNVEGSSLHKLLKKSLVEMPQKTPEAKHFDQMGNERTIFVTDRGLNTLLREPLQLIFTLVELGLIDKTYPIIERHITKAQLPELLACNFAGIRVAAEERIKELG
jgi:hypothetical protein